jgi:hypothetical protein
MPAQVVPDAAATRAGSVPGIARSGRTSRIVVRAKVQDGQLAIFLARHKTALRTWRKPQFTFTSIEVDGTLYTGDAGNYVLRNKVTMPPPAGSTFTASVPFSDVPIGNNEWAVLEFYGNAADGTQVALGDLMGMLNVSTSPVDPFPILDGRTSTTFQVFLMLLDNGIISTYDLDNTPTLAGEIADAIKVSGLTPNGATGLFTNGQLQLLYDAIAPKSERSYVVDPGGVPGAITLVRDYTNASEVNLAGSVQGFSSNFTPNEPIPQTGSIFGVACGNMIVAQAQTLAGTTTSYPTQVGACQLLDPTGAPLTIAGVYGGHMIVGATNAPYNAIGAPVPLSGNTFLGGITSVAGVMPHKVDSFPIKARIAQQAFEADDPAGFAFGTAFFEEAALGQPPMFEVLPAFGQQLLSGTTFSPPVGNQFAGVIVPADYSAKNSAHAVEALTFNPFAIAPSNLQICGGVNCHPLAAGKGTFARPFADGGNDLNYFKWAPSGTATKITPGNSGGYAITVNGAGTAKLTSAVSTTLVPQQIIEIDATTPVGTVWTVTATDSNKLVYENSAAQTAAGSTSITMYSVGNIVNVVNMALSFTTSGKGALVLTRIKPGAISFGK